MEVNRSTMPTAMSGPSSGFSMGVPRVIANGSNELVSIIGSSLA
jgi:hypothetical protein